MTDTLKKSRTSGSAVSELTSEKSVSPAPVATGRLKSLLSGGGYHPGSGVTVPAAGQIFEVSDDTGVALIAAGLAEIAPLGAEEK